MDTATEQEIIRHFFRKDRQERLYWELSGKKRAEFYWHLAGTRELKPECLHDISGDQQPLKQIFRQTGAGGTVYFIGSSHIGALPLDDAITRAGQCEMCLIYFGNGKGFWQGEQNPAQPRYLLYS